MKAWRITHKKHYPESVAIYEAKTRNQARYRKLLAAKEASISLNYVDIVAVRAQEFDAIVGTAFGTGCLGWKDDIDSWGCLDDRRE